MHNLTIEQIKKLSRACTATRQAIAKGHLTLKAARALLAGNAQTASAGLGLTIGCNADRVVTHDLDDSRVIWFVADCLHARKVADVLQALKDLRADCHAAIDRANA